MFYPGDEILAIYDWYLYDLPKPIIIDTTSAQTYLTMSLKATNEDWKIENKLISSYSKLFGCPALAMHGPTPSGKNGSAFARAP